MPICFNSRYNESMNARLGLWFHLLAVFGAASSFVVVGVLLPGMMDHYNLTLAEAGVVPVVRGMGEIVAAFFMALVIRKIGERNTFLGGHGLIAFAFGAMAVTWGYPVFLFLLFLSGVGVQLIVGTVTSMQGRLGGARQGRSVSMVFLAISGANIVAPALVGWGLHADYEWRTILTLIGGLFVLLTVVQWLVGPLSQRDPAELNAESKQTSDGGSIYRDIGLWMTGITLMVWISSQGLFLMWLPTYTVSALGVAPELAGLPLSGYTLGNLLSRIFLLNLADRFSPRKMMMASSTIGGLFSIGVVTADSLSLLMIFSFIVGLMSGMMTPLFFTFAGKRLGAGAELVGFLFSALLISEAFTPGIAGMVAESFGLTWGISLIPLSLFGSAFLLVFYPRVTSRFRQGVS